MGRWTRGICAAVCLTGLFAAVTALAGDVIRRGGDLQGPRSMERVSPERVQRARTVEAACREYAETAVNQYREAKSGNCGTLAHPVWSGDFRHHFTWCMRVGDLKRANGETAARAARLQECGRTAAQPIEIPAPQAQPIEIPNPVTRPGRIEPHALDPDGGERPERSGGTRELRQGVPVPLPRPAQPYRGE